MWQESGTTCRVEASHVLECNKDNGKKRAVSATSEEVSQHGQIDEQALKSIDVGKKLMCAFVLKLKLIF
jgi:hypothetical protein